MKEINCYLSMETNWLQERANCKFGNMIAWEIEIQITNSRRGALSEDCEKLAVPGRLDKSVDGLEESGCGTGRWMFPRWNWVTDAKIRPFSAGAGEACMNGWQQGGVVLLVQPKWISSPSMFLCFRLDTIMHSNIKPAWTMQTNCQWLKFLWVSAETFQEF